MKTTRHSLLAKGLMVLLSLLILVFAFTYSWFSVAQPDAEASGLSTKTSTGYDFEYAIGFKTSQTGGEYLVTDFTNTELQDLDIEHLNVDGYFQENGVTPFNFNLLYDYTPIDITGDGSTLIRPNMDYGNWKVNTGTSDYSIAEANTQYVSFDIIVRSKSPSTLSLGPNSYAVGNCETNPGDGSLVGASATRKSDYGNFSKDAIVGAIRVAFIDFDNSNEDITADSLMEYPLDEKLAAAPSLLWVVRPDIYLNNNGNDSAVSGWSLNTGVIDTDTFNLASAGLTDSEYSTYQHQQYDVFNGTNQDPHNYVVTNASSYVHISSKDENDNFYQFNDTVPITHLTYSKVVNGETYYYGKIRVRVWVEGTDTEARRATSGGKFSLNFDLTTNG